MISTLTKPILFAHRGASAYAPENTLAAFELAIQQKADAIELDVKLSVDGEVIVIHDEKVDRTTDGNGTVSKLDLATIKSLDAGRYFDITFSGERIPTLNEVLEIIGSRIFINVELTNYSSPSDHLPQKTAEIVKDHNQKENILFSSFNPIALIKIRKQLPDCPIGLLAAPGFGGFLALSVLGKFIPHNALHPDSSDTNQNLIKKCHLKGLSVHTYTVNNFERMLDLFRWQIDGIFTDNIPLAQQARLIVKKEKNSLHDSEILVH